MCAALWLCAAATPAAAEGAAPALVEVGVYVASLYSPDVVDGSIGVELYLWWITADPEYRPFDVMQILNGRSWTTRGVYRRELSDGRHYSAGFVQATINHGFDLRNYPFDRQAIEIVIETPYTVEEVLLVPDHSDSLISEFVSVTGFRVEPLTLREVTREYASQFGLGDAGTSRFSRLVIGVGLVRESGRVLVALSVGFIVANLIAGLIYFIQISALSVRTAMVASAIFAAVGNMYLLTTELNPAAGSLLVDRIAGATFAQIVVALLTSMVVERVARTDMRRATRINWVVFALVFATLAALYSHAIRDALG